MKKYNLKPRRKKKKYNYPGRSKNIFNNLTNDEELCIYRDVIFSDIFEINLYDRSKVRGCFALLKSTRQILSLAFDYRMKADLVVKTIKGLNNFHIEKGIWHSDQGKQYGAKVTLSELLLHKLESSMSRPGTPTDNPYAERFVGIFKLAVSEKSKYKNLVEFLKSAEKWVNLYNNKKPHESLNQIAPNQLAKQNNLQIVPHISLN